jgi:hypothetical protein
MNVQHAGDGSSGDMRVRQEQGTDVLQQDAAHGETQHGLDCCLASPSQAIVRRKQG